MRATNAGPRDDSDHRKAGAGTLVCVTYVSSPVQPLDAQQRRELAAAAQAFNAGVDVTGALLCTDDVFVQYIEGPPAGIDAVWERILASPLHRRITVIERTIVDRRAFEGWAMWVGDDPAELGIGTDEFDTLTGRLDATSPAWMLAAFRKHGERLHRVRPG